jgi:hypothetical protein
MQTAEMKFLPVQITDAVQRSGKENVSSPNIKIHNYRNKWVQNVQKMEEVRIPE